MSIFSWSSAPGEVCVAFTDKPPHDPEHEEAIRRIAKETGTTVLSPVVPRWAGEDEVVVLTGSAVRELSTLAAAAGIELQEPSRVPDPDLTRYFAPHRQGGDASLI